LLNAIPFRAERRAQELACIGGRQQQIVLAGLVGAYQAVGVPPLGPVLQMTPWKESEYNIPRFTKVRAFTGQFPGLIVAACMKIDVV